MANDAIPIIRFIPGLMSIIGSSTIIFILLRSKEKLSSMYRRIIFGLSISDFFQSSSLIFSLLLSPILSNNINACNTQAFFMHFGFSAAPLYNLSLCIYYVLTVYDKKESSLHKVEIILHLINILWPIGGGIFLLVTNHFNFSEQNDFCWIFSKPNDCTIDSDIGCERGGFDSRYKWIFQGVHSMVVFLIIAISMTIICVKVIGQEMRMEERFSTRSFYRSKEVITNNNNHDEASRSSQNKRCSVIPLWKSSRNGNQTRNGTKREVLHQSLFYLLAYFIPTFFPYIYLILERRGKLNTTVSVLTALTVPLQGLFNFLVFIRPRILQIKKSNPEYSWLKSLVITIQKLSKSTSSTVAIKRERSSRRRSHLRRRSKSETVTPASSSSLAPLSPQEEKSLPMPTVLEIVDQENVSSQSQPSPPQMQTETSETTSSIPVIPSSTLTEQEITPYIIETDKHNSMQSIIETEECENITSAPLDMPQQQMAIVDNIQIAEDTP